MTCFLAPVTTLHVTANPYAISQTECYLTDLCEHILRQ